MIATAPVKVTARVLDRNVQGFFLQLPIVPIDKPTSLRVAVTMFLLHRPRKGPG